MNKDKEIEDKINKLKIGLNRTMKKWKEQKKMENIGKTKIVKTMYQDPTGVPFEPTWANLASYLGLLGLNVCSSRYSKASLGVRSVSWIGPLSIKVSEYSYQPWLSFSQSKSSMHSSSATNSITNRSLTHIRVDETLPVS